jgi:hypothetical protein
LKKEQRQKRVRFGFEVDENSSLSVEDVRLAESLFSRMAARRLQSESATLEVTEPVSDSKPEVNHRKHGKR